MGGAYRAASVLHWQARLSNIPTGLFLSLVTHPIADLFLAEHRAGTGCVTNQEK